RPSATVPVFDFTEAIPLAIEAPAPAEPAPSWRLADPPVIEARLAERLAAAPPPEPGASPADVASGSPPEVLPADAAPPVEPEPEGSPDPAASSEPAKPRRVHVAAAIISDPAGRGLVVRKHGSSSFMQAGGKIEKGESALAALI